MVCPKCGSENIGCIDSRPKNDCRRRRYRCYDCEHRFTTLEFYADGEMMGLINRPDLRRAAELISVPKFRRLLKQIIELL